ncbi:endonuclease/exonuclease/phosphatase family protein [Echinicola marina]|uniref:endonuclease/exonuclease/phosphatase family protein n=1 Tax=Echinicola marina TaxID=2859768 RepID=UPI001CF61D6C|nr:endonuclease/exonuclease/phosphatase family protein [Echinicola marina]UCS93643.1 endonuclease/exonuclease/phosphatase family protein [Echinicola marina]
MKNQSKLLLILILSLACFQCKPKETIITILSYNIYHGENSYESGKSNLEEIAQLIKDIDPDFVAMQEVDSATQRTASIRNGKALDLTAELAKTTGMYGFFAKAINFSNGGYGEGLLSKYPAKMSKLDLPIPEGGEGRTMALATAKMPDGTEITFGATHLCHQYETNRIAQSEAILKHQNNIDNPFLFAGDLNFKPDSKAYDSLKENFIDAAEIVGNPQNTFPTDAPSIRIDYVWLSKKSNWEVIEAKVIDVAYSDHKPLLVKVKLK